MSRRTVQFIVVGLLATVVLAVGVSQFASSQPDGLERVAADQGIDADAGDHSLATSPFADYGTSGVQDDRVGTGVAGLVGVLATFVVAAGAVWAAGSVLARRRAAPVPGAAPPT